jgi:hypothetical protein
MPRSVRVDILEASATEAAAFEMIGVEENSAVRMIGHRHERAGDAGLVDHGMAGIEFKGETQAVIGGDLAGMTQAFRDLGQFLLGCVLARRYHQRVAADRRGGLAALDDRGEQPVMLGAFGEKQAPFHAEDADNQSAVTHEPDDVLACHPGFRASLKIYETELDRRISRLPGNLEKTGKGRRLQRPRMQGQAFSNLRHASFQSEGRQGGKARMTAKIAVDVRQGVRVFGQAGRLAVANAIRPN